MTLPIKIYVIDDPHIYQLDNTTDEAIEDCMQYLHRNTKKVNKS